MKPSKGDPMKIKTLVASLFALLCTSASYAASPLRLQVLTASPDGFLVTSTLITGNKETVLIDGQMTVSDAEKVVEVIKESRKTLTTIYVTHSHPDHYFGLNVLAKAFPKAKLVALPATVKKINETWEAKVKTWKPQYNDAIPSKPLIPQVLTGNTLPLEGEKLEITGPVQGDEAENSFIWVPALKAVVTGDIVYNGVYVWTAETTPATRIEWLKAIDQIAALKPEIVVAGHKVPGLKDDATSLTFMKNYLLDFDASLANSKSPDELLAKMKAKYPALALEIILQIGVASAKPVAMPEKK
jgi:glyoxylase-like metal-dependent hydrolase (beta-lactamase superfamily II)